MFLWNCHVCTYHCSDEGLSSFALSSRTAPQFCFVALPGFLLSCLSLKMFIFSICHGIIKIQFQHYERVARMVLYLAKPTASHPSPTAPDALVGSVFPPSGFWERSLHSFVFESPTQPQTQMNRYVQKPLNCDLNLFLLLFLVRLVTLRYLSHRAECKFSAFLLFHPNTWIVIMSILALKKVVFT